MACAGCKLMRRRCSPDCFLAPYFPGDDPQRFACVHYVYGTSNVTKMLQDVPPNQRAIAAETLYQEANARLKDPVYGCIGDIASLNQQIYDTQGELAEVRAQFAVFTGLNTQKDLFVGDYVPSYGTPGLVEVPEAEGASSSKLGVVEVPVAEGVLYRKLGNNVPSYFAPGNYSLLQGAVEVPVAEGALSKKLGNNGPSYGAPSNYSLLQGLVEVPVAEDASSDKLGNKRKRNYKGVRQTSAGNWIAQVHVGTFKTAEDAAMAYDKAALELHGHEARLNFPDSEAFPYVSYADSAQLLSSGENSPSKRRRDSQSAPGSVSAPLSHKDGFNQTSSVLSDLLDSFLEHGSNSSMVSLLLASLEQQTVGELTYGSATQSTLSHMFSEDNILPWLHQNTENCIQATEGNVEDSPCQAEPMQNGISVHHDGSKSVVKVIEIKEESQEA